MLLHPRKLHNLSTEEALARVGQVALGRLVYYSRALPNIWPTTHFVDGDTIVINAHSDSDLGRALRASPLSPFVTAYEVDVFDSRHIGWCVVVTGPMEILTEEEIGHRDGLAALRAKIPGWAATEDLMLLGIRAEVVSGYELGGELGVAQLEPETA
ncbi:pyridoxamine 5'-phosphate oxidase family protein [Phytomonospora sp. NPDC050363]|uniref:pyridoxamine 5'-phosphate oxidase family protein n=1 Tax=Phytomonospora sp. NPDC050363 TaxID=3155642 RepID=UPI0033CB6DFD